MQNFEISILEKKIGYSFNDKEILKEALTHSSYANELRAKKLSAQCNERLEFFGDAVLSLVVSRYLFEANPDLPEGTLTRKRASFVRSQSLADIAHSLCLGDFLYLGRGEEKNNGRERQSILEDAMEALIAAMYIDAGDSGYYVVSKFLLPFIEERLRTKDACLDPKTELQQLIQQAEGDFLVYTVVKETGPDHNKQFEVVAQLNSNVIGRGRGRSKREAEQSAAKEALKLFGEIK